MEIIKIISFTIFKIYVDIFEVLCYLYSVKYVATLTIIFTIVFKA